ncbi:hypothetical protein AGOR_G00100980 [Albula goreensis]|uniref:DDE Tnp4 domain-containing protein n=1 Tax=Albula goreensis TaxID=1534307 RepID=A0A8T3DLW1_9TELE|nr:hypothetical protein AGOR_G00100980 [Albula goreensis]
MNMDIQKKAIALVAAMYVLKSHRRRHCVWVHPILRKRKEHSEFHWLVQELRLNGVLFQQYFRLDVAQCDELLSRVGPRIARMNMSYREAIGATERLAICLQGVPAVLEFSKLPGIHRWKTCGHSGSPNSGSWFHNYKGTFSIVLLAVVDSEYLFRVVDVGGYGRNSDGGTLANSNFGRGLLNGTVDLPADSIIPGSEHRGSFPYVLVGDEAFPLCRCLMRPYPGFNMPREKRIFNYCLSHSRLTVECSFGILSSQWRLYCRVIYMAPEKVELCVKATCILHNFTRVTTMRGRRRENTSHTPDMAAAALRPVGRMGSNNAPREAIKMREAICEFFNQESAVPWQNHVLAIH